MGRSHDYHCPACHTWSSGFDLIGNDLMECPCGEGELFYDENHDGCEGGCDDES